MKTRCKLATTVATLAIGCGSLFATELYNLDFTPPEVGAYQIVFGHPTIQSSVGPFTDALVFHAVTSYDQIQLAIGEVGPRYEIQYDVLAHNLLNSQYAFSLLLDTPEVRVVSLHGGQNNVQVFQSSPYTIGAVAGFLNDQVYHFNVSVDLEANLWSVAIDGTQQFVNPFNATSLNSVRFNLSPWIGGAVNAPGTYVALDNVQVSVVPEPSVCGLLGASGVTALVLFRRKARRI